MAGSNDETAQEARTSAASDGMSGENLRRGIAGNSHGGLGGVKLGRAFDNRGGRGRLAVWNF